MLYAQKLVRLILVTAFIAPAYGQACLGPDSEDYVLLDTLPSKASLQSVVAKVEVLSRADQSAVVRVLEPIKGVTQFQEFEVVSGGTSCSWLDRRTRFFQSDQNKAKSNIYFIAGEFSSKVNLRKQFQGSWRGELKISPH